VFQLFSTDSQLLVYTLPLGIQAITNFIQAGRASASWLFIVLVVFGVALVGVLSLMQLRIWKICNKIFIRSSFEFAVRLPKFKK
jgi:hypothetical protein